MSLIDDINETNYLEKATAARADKLEAFRIRMVVTYEHCGKEQLKAFLVQARAEFHTSQSELNAIRCEVLNELIGKLKAKPEPQCIFSGDYSRKMWDEINNAKTWRDLQDALYTVCCRLQEFETRMSWKEDKG